MDDRKSILVVEDEPAFLELLERNLNQNGYAVITAENGEDALELLRQNRVNLILTDLKMPKMDGLQLLKAAKILSPEIEVIMMTAHGDVDTAVEAMQEGAYHFIRKPFKRNEILLTVTRALEKQALVCENQSIRKQLEAQNQLGNIIGISPVIQELVTKVQYIAPSMANVLILGETGTGKEVFADALHAASPRRDKPMIKVNCAALPENLLESELFGYEKGAFTDAKMQKPGRFELADGGTLFLDEIGEMPTHLQVKLLRVLQEGEFERLGGTKTIKVDVRLIAATNKNLPDEVKAGNFREDLFYRLNVITLEIPPLRERMDDIPLLVDSFIKQYSEKNSKSIRGISREALDALEICHWRGNIRELQSAIEQAVVLTPSDVIGLSDLPASIRLLEDVSGSIIPIRLGTPLEEIERQAVLGTLKLTGGDKELAAQLLGVSSRTIYRKLREIPNLSEDRAMGEGSVASESRRKTVQAR